MGPALTLRCEHPGIWSHLKSGSSFSVFKPALVYICQDNGSQPTGHPRPEEQPRNVLKPHEGCYSLLSLHFDFGRGPKT